MKMRKIIPYNPKLKEHAVDFYCKDLMLAIVVDGKNHYGNRDKDYRKDEKLNEFQRRGHSAFF